MLFRKSTKISPNDIKTNINKLIKQQQKYYKMLRQLNNVINQNINKANSEHMKSQAIKNTNNLKTAKNRTQIVKQKVAKYRKKLKWSEMPSFLRGKNIVRKK